MDAFLHFLHHIFLETEYLINLAWFNGQWTLGIFLSSSPWHEGYRHKLPPLALYLVLGLVPHAYAASTLVTELPPQHCFPSIPNIPMSVQEHEYNEWSAFLSEKYKYILLREAAHENSSWGNLMRYLNSLLRDTHISWLYFLLAGTEHST